MNLLGMITFLLLIIAVDYFNFDRDRKRWGWLKGASRAKKAICISSILLLSIISYLGLSM
ncbi:hypothetical protein U9M49_04495 [Cytobacillus sp. OWB-43]|uniref:hypothetical protein n=1 Tax=unclassified Cytobacillus TaxID=2675268 RepID=UPI002AFDF976|nr:hypothetical protein [Cytobacillus sp. OWB-43]MEA1852336.1 hypothetical protein [Cytobacillus sp. OWB-43]